MRLAIILALVASPAAAVDLQKFQSPTQKSVSQSASKSAATSTARAWSDSYSTSNAAGGSVSNTITFAPGGSAPSRVTYDFSNQVPDTYAPALAGGGACTESASGGTSQAGFGLSLGLSWEGDNCGIRNEMIVLDNIGQRKEAQVHGCLHLERVKATYELMGKDCLGNPLKVVK